MVIEIISLWLSWGSNLQPLDWQSVWLPIALVICYCLFGFNVAFNNFSVTSRRCLTFNNFSVISRQCLVAIGSSMLTFIVLPHWSINVPDTWHDTTPSHIILTLGGPVQALSLSAKRGAASTILNDFGMSQPRIEPVTSRSLEQTLYRPSSRSRSMRNRGKLWGLTSSLSLSSISISNNCSCRAVVGFFILQ